MSTMRFGAGLLGTALFAVVAHPLSALAQEDPLPGVIERVKPSVAVVRALDAGGASIAQGTGFLIAPGQVVTCRHVLAGSAGCEVAFGNGAARPVLFLLDEDPETDLALLAVSPTDDLPKPLLLAEAPPREGERIAIIGSPLGLGISTSDGIISAVQDSPPLGTVLQVSAPISPGSSGSPIVSMKGLVVGVAFAQATEGQNIGFGVSIQRARALKARRQQHLREVAIADDRSFARYFDALGASFAKDYERAARCYRQILRDNPSDLFAQEGLGECLHSLGQLEAALDQFTRITDSFPQFATAHINRGAVLDRLGRHAEALASFRKAEAIDPAGADIQFNLGLALSNLGSHDMAVPYFLAALRIDPNCTRALNGLAIAYRALGKPDDGIRCLQKAIALDPEEPIYHHNLGVAYDRRGRSEEAQAEFETALRLRPTYVDALTELGSLFDSLGKAEKAVECLRKAAALAPTDPNTWFNLGTAYMHMGDHTRALENLQKALELRPTFGDALGNMGNVYGELGHSEKALQFLRKAIALDPSRPEGHSDLGVVLASCGRLDEAVAEYKEALRLSPDFGNARTCLGNALAKLGRLDEAIVEHRKAIATNPRNPDYRRNLAIALRGAKRWTEALVEFEAVMVLCPEDSEVRCDVAWLQINVGNLKGAVPNLEKAVDLNKRNARAHFLLGLCYQELGHHERALAEVAILRSLGSELAPKLAEAIGQ